ncbi:MAG: ABC transporter ATP-binding protein [Lachnospiraceae bacterium]|nr:ABC transporter ATP-binding protein [Lachnospiraceae bacterium]
MTKNGRTLREDIQLIIRGVKEFDKLLPKQMAIVALKCIVTACLPYIAVMMSTGIVNELTGAQNRAKLLTFALLSVGLTFILYLWKAMLEAKISIGYSRLFSTHELLLTNKAYKLPYESLESSRVRNLREQVSGSLNLSGGGMASLYWDMEVVFTNLCSVLISMILCAGFFGSLCSKVGSRGWETIFSYFVLLLLLVVSCAYVSCKMTGKRFDVAFQVFEEGAKFKRFGEFYTLEYLSDEDAALDVRIFRQEEMILKESYRRCYEHFAKGKTKEMRAVNKYDSVKLLCTALCGVTVYFLVGLKALDGTIGIGSVVMLYTAVTGLILTLSELAQIWTDLRNNNEHLIRYFAYMDLPETEECVAEVECSDASETAGSQTMGIAIKEIRFEQVSFQYPESDSWVLQDLNLTIQAGEKLAIVGQNGCGKSTMIKLLCRLYQPTKGRILLNGRDIWTYPQKEYTGLLATVFQDFSLFAFSIGENVAAGREYDAERVKGALQKAGLGEKFGRLQKGMEQVLFHDFEEEGENLSGGEAQKLAIARALYKDAPIMILDEPTAALDPYAEFEIYQSFYELSKGKTLLSISHRLSSCRMCDRILVLEAGKLIQSGSHEELLGNTQGKYYQMWHAQAQYYK